MREQPYDGQTLFGPSRSRKYLNAAERQRFLAVTCINVQTPLDSAQDSVHFLFLRLSRP